MKQSSKSAKEKKQKSMFDYFVDALKPQMMKILMAEIDEICGMIGVLDDEDIDINIRF